MHGEQVLVPIAFFAMITIVSVAWSQRRGGKGDTAT